MVSIPGLFKQHTQYTKVDKPTCMEKKRQVNKVKKEKLYDSNWANVAQQVCFEYE